MTAAVIDPITFAVVKNGLDTIVDDMAYTVMRTSRSSIVRDVLDYSCTIADRHGRILTQAKTVALHLGAVRRDDDVSVVKLQYRVVEARQTLIVTQYHAVVGFLCESL